MDETSRNRVKSLETTNAIIEALNELQGARVTELAKHLDRPQSVVYTHLTTLSELEYVVRDGMEYRLGLRFLQFGERVRQQFELYNVARPQAEYLADESGELITLMVEEHGKGVYLYVAQGSRDINYPAISGMRTNLHCSAVGKSILAHLPEERVDDIVREHGLPAQTPNTITDRADLDETLAEIRDEGLAFDMEEFREGMRSVGAPILQDDTPVGSLSIAGPAHRMKGERLEREMPELLLRSINIVELNLNEPNIR